MSKQQDDNLEQFFHNRVENYEFHYREEDWDKLESMLDVADSIRVTAYKRTAIWIGAGLILATLLFLFIGFKNGLFTLSENVNTTTEPDKTETKDPTQNIQDQVKSQHESISVEAQPLKGTTQAAMIPLQNKDNQAVNKPDVILLVPFTENKALVTDKSTGQNFESGSTLLLTNKEKYSENEPTPTFGIPVATKAREPTIRIYKTTLESRGWFIENEQSTVMIKEPVEISPSPGLKENFAWTFSIAADYSAVGTNGFNGPAIRTGVFFEYYLFDRFSAGIGLNYSKKKYKAHGWEYTPTKGFWTYGAVPETIEGACNILDIPINFSYYFPNANGQRFVVRGGISSWLMLEEEYWYKYESNDPDLIHWWGTKNENYHYFSIINISAGFEHPLSNRVGVLVEPYLNIPLTGVGFGKVDLYSTGVKFSMKLKHYKIKPIKID